MKKFTPLIPNIAPVCYRQPSDILPTTDTATIKVLPLKKESGTELHWFDDLCRGSIHIPEDLKPDAEQRGRSVIMLLTGPPGTGKSTFALELSCSLATQKIDGSPAKVFYVSAEESGRRLEEKARSNGWVPHDFKIHQCYEGPALRGGALPPAGLLIRGSETEPGPSNDPRKCGGVSVQPDEPQADRSPRPAPQLSGISNCWKCERGTNRGPGLTVANLSTHSASPTVSARSPEPRFFDGNPIDVLVVDSLNTYSPDPNRPLNKIQKFDQIQNELAEPNKCGRRNPRLIIVVIDTTGGEDQELRHCEFSADILFRFGWEEKLGYTLRTFEIVKMRGQSHAWGKQRVKIYPWDQDERGKPTTFARGLNAPFLAKKAGIYLFPSMHTYISHFSHARTIKPANPGDAPLEFPGWVSGLNSQIASNVAMFRGVPPAGCTAVIGKRGTMKSHLAYYFLLAHASGILSKPGRPLAGEDQRPKRNCLLLSLRDDQDGAIETLAQIAESQGLRKLAGAADGRSFVEDLIRQDRLEILENDIGMVSPEELFHKIYVAVHRPRALLGFRQEGTGAVQVVMAAGLDQLEARFPLIAQEAMFVPALIQLLRWNRVCSMIISSVGESSTASGQSMYGLLPMADLILEMDQIDRHNLSNGYRWPGDFPDVLWPRDIEQVSRVETRRVPGGQIGSRVGFLYRTPDGKFKYIKH